VTGELELDAAEGFLDPGLRDELPGLTLRWLTLPGRPGKSTDELKTRLRALSNRFRGESVVTMRTQPIPRAYRVFFRQIGLDPDVTRVPSEQAAVSRLLHGHLAPRDAIADALLIAVVETGVPVWALDAEVLDASGLGIRPSRAGERLGSAGEGAPLAEGRLVVADGRSVHAVLFGEVAPGHAPGPATTRVALFAVGVAGVPTIHVEEALWTAAELLGRASAV
jgi:DNA/RNA-binding domain of Phe-tRNA-synthetase-like protein